MKTIVTTTLTSTLAITICIAVCLIGVHAKEVTALSKVARGNITPQVKKVVGDDPTTFKAHHDPHNHVDHQTSKSITKTFGDQTQADARSLRKVRHNNKQRRKLSLPFGLSLPFATAS